MLYIKKKPNDTKGVIYTQSITITHSESTTNKNLKLHGKQKDAEIMCWERQEKAKAIYPLPGVIMPKSRGLSWAARIWKFLSGGS